MLRLMSLQTGAQQKRVKPHGVLKTVAVDMRLYSHSVYDLACV
jgi:hypothetical protein